MRHYREFFTVPVDYSPVMTAAEINKTPERWLDFYPHTDFEDICKTLLSVLKDGKKSVWITGNLGTGKTNVALVVQKLFMDDETRVIKYMEKYDNKGLSDRSSFEKDLFDRRNEGTLVVYDYNSSNLGADVDLLVRLEQGIVSALAERNLVIPARSIADTAIDRVKREGENFFKTRDTIQSQLRHLNANIKTVEQLVNALSNPSDSPKLLADVERVFRKDSIYLPFDVPTLRKWIQDILKANNYRSIMYLFDEFHPFIAANKEQLKTFEDITETPGINRFFLIPLTHMEISAYLAEGSQRYKYAHDRFYFRKLQMPNDTAFRLAKHAMEDIKEHSTEWAKAKEDLWDSVSSLVTKFNNVDDPTRESFYDILPIHPMAAFLLKYLAEKAKSNQRSFFEYLKGGADGTEFQDFIDAGGPEVAGKQFLTVDYLWQFFVGNRKDSGLDSEIANIGAFYKQTKNRVFQNQTEDAPELRILKTVLLFCLLDKLAPGGHDRLKPTVENIELSFKGDGTIADPIGIIEELEKKHCFSVVNGNISLFTVSTIKPEEIEKHRAKFHEILHEKVAAKLEEHTKNHRKYSSGRFDIRVSDCGHTTLANITTATRDKYTENINKDDGSVCLWFVVAKDYAEQLKIPLEIERVLKQLNDHRILMFTFPNLAFCHNNKNLWDEYIRQYARYTTENDAATKKQIRYTLDGIENDWFKELQKNDALIRSYRYKNGQIETLDTSWNQFKELIVGYVRKTLKYSVDHLGFQDPHFGNSSLQAYAKAGITLSGSAGPIANLVNTLKKNGLTDDENWFDQNPNHPLSAIHSLFEKKFANTVGKGGQQSIRKVYIELKRAPYGLRYNALSAFVLGYCLRDILQKNYQWTNGQMTRPLDIDTLAEIIDTVVKDDGADRLGNKEKLICRLSKEAREFIKSAPTIFGVTPNADATVESVLTQIQSKVESESAKVPLWVLPEYIRFDNNSQADEIESFLNHICTVFTASSKGNKLVEKGNAVDAAGEILSKNPDIVSIIANYIQRANFLKAFEIYVDKTNPALQQLAKQLGDASLGYCESIRERCQETAGWLWRPADISREIDDVLCEYEIIFLAKPLCGYTDFTEYQKVFNTLKNAVTNTNHLPKPIIEAFYPMLADFLSALQGGGTAKDIKLALKQYFDVIKRLFFDHTKQEALVILQSKLPDVKLEGSDLLSLLNEMSGGFGLDENTFIANIRAKIEEFAKHSVVLKIKEEWTHLSGASSPAEWAIDNGIPARYIFDNHPDAVDLLRAIENPETFAAAKLENILKILKEVKVANVADCQRALLFDVVPPGYKKFNIDIASLLNDLQDNYGKQPNNWPLRPDVSGFIKKQYRWAIAPRIKEKIRDKSAEDIKAKILALADDNPELGLLFWED